MIPIAQVMSQVLTELTAALVVAGSPVEHSLVVPGESVAGDYSNGEDMAWVRLSTSYSSVEVGVVDERVGACGSGIGIELEIGILRCYQSDPSGLDQVELLEMVEQQIEDMDTIRCVLLRTDAYGEKDFILGAYRPLGPQGGLYGGVWTLMLGLL